MDCRTFRANHLQYLDDTLTEQALVEMQRHLSECEACTRHDVAVRRGLMLLHNLPTIEPSPDFAAKLQARLRQEKIAMEREAIARRRVDSLIRSPRRGPYAAAAASVLLAGSLAIGAGLWRAGLPDESTVAAEATLPPVVASLPQVELPPVASPVLVAAASTGVSLWPAMLLVDEGPAHLMTAELRMVSDEVAR